MKDLKLTRRDFDHQTSDREGVDLVRSPSGDLTTVEGRPLLAQAIINRLLTRKGELAALGHPTYGCRLYELVGELNNARTRGRAELYIRESLAQEPRIAEITEVAFALPDRQLGRNTLTAAISLVPVGDHNPLTVEVPIL